MHRTDKKRLKERNGKRRGGGKGILKREKLRTIGMDLVHESQNEKGLHMPNEMKRHEKNECGED